MRQFFAVLLFVSLSGCFQQDSWRHYEGGGAYCDSPFVSDLSEYVLLSSPDCGRGDIMRYDFGTKETTALTSGDAFDANPMISADGKIIFFEREQKGMPHIHAIEVGNGKER